ncbi:MAG: MFS transporter [Ignavibacteriales bacterium]|nr:MFS transporter [Ignavibacteriales bacterium]
MHESSNKKIALIISTLSSFLTPFMLSALNIALPSIGKEFGLNTIELGWIATSYILSASIFLIPFGKLADMIGRKKIFLYGMLIYGLISLLIVFSFSGTMLIIFRAIQGVGAAMIFGTGMAILISVTPPTERGKVLGINVASVYLGLSLGPFVGGFLTQHIGWQSIFYLNFITSIIVVILGATKLHGEWAEEAKGKFDLWGGVFFSVTMFLLMFGFSRIPQSVGVISVCAGVISLTVFIFWEMQADNPILPIRLFTQNTVFAYSNLAALINYSATSAITFLLSLYLQSVKGLSPQMAGLVLVAQPILMAVLSPVAGRMSDRYEPRIMASLGMGLTVIGLLIFSLLEADSSILFIIMNLSLLGVGFGLFSSPNQNAAMTSVSKEVYGIASATLGTMRLTGQMLSMGIVMLIISVGVGRVQITPEYYPQFTSSLKIIFAVFAAICVGGIFASLARGKVR